MRVTFLGTGTSVGVPMIGCDCAVCRSSNPRNRRRRSSLYVEVAGTALLVDTPPDLRDQALTYGIGRVDAVLYTHAHADHIFGFDDLRRFNTLQGVAIPCWGHPKTLEEIRRIFDYAFRPQPAGVYRPQVTLHPAEGPFRIGALTIEPVPVQHGEIATVGYRMEAEGRSLGYVPDCLTMDERAIERFAGMDVMVLDALRHTPHLTHAHLEASLAMLRRIGARRSLLTHLCHDLDHEWLEKELPPDVKPAWDGLVLEW